MVKLYCLKKGKQYNILEIERIIMKVKLTQEQIDTMSYDDVAYLILEAYSKKMKIQDLFKRVLKAMELPDEEFTNGIGDFFELLLTDKRFIMLENGDWDLKINHSTKIVLEDDEEEETFDLIEEETEETEEQDDSEVNYDEDTVEDDDEDELEDLVILDENDENEIM